MASPEEWPVPLANKPSEGAVICRPGVPGPDGQPAPRGQSTQLMLGDFYPEAGLIIFSEADHLRRGHCGRSGGRHCPDDRAKEGGMAGGVGEEP